MTPPTVPTCPAPSPAAVTTSSATAPAPPASPMATTATWWARPPTPSTPGLGPLAKNGGPTRTHALLAGSPAIDRGDKTCASATDQRGVSRPRDGDGSGSRLIDIGAF